MKVVVVAETATAIVLSLVAEVFVVLVVIGIGLFVADLVVVETVAVLRSEGVIEL